MVDLVSSYGQWMAGNNTLPKLFINAEPGSILTGKARDFCRSWPNQTEVTVKGTHFIQEDSPKEIGQAVAQWLDTIKYYPICRCHQITLPEGSNHERHTRIHNC